MYNYIVAVIYNWAIGKGKGHWLSRQHACNGVTFALLIHLPLTSGLLKNYFETKFGRFVSIEKSSIIIGVVLFFLAIRSFYSKKRIQKTEIKYGTTAQLKKGSGWIVFSIIFIPLLVLIIVFWQR